MKEIPIGQGVPNLNTFRMLRPSLEIFVCH